MYTTVIRQYLVNGRMMSYAEYYKGDENADLPLARAKCECEALGKFDDELHTMRLSEIQVICARIAQNLDVPLF